jgi:hypothetical protein
MPMQRHHHAHHFLKSHDIISGQEGIGIWRPLSHSHDLGLNYSVQAGHQ